MTRLESPPTATRPRNLAEHVRDRALEAPDRIAVMAYARTRGRARLGAARETITNAELLARVARTAKGLERAGVRKKDRVVVFVRPGIDLVAILYALYALGAVPVMLDPGLGKESLLACIARTKPRVFIGIPLAHLVRRLYAKSFASVELFIGAGPSLPFCGTPLTKLRTQVTSDELVCAEIGEHDEAAILFTSGSTGPPKGVAYTHSMFDAQVAALRNLYRFEPGEVDVACLPAFGLFGPALGLTSIFPDIDPTRPGKCDPQRIVNALIENKATNTFGSPAIWRRIVPYCVERGIRFDSLKRVLIAGAPVPPHLIEPFLSLLPKDADIFTPYGATECLPVANVGGREILREHRQATDAGAGTCVGRPVPEAKVEIIAIGDEPIADWNSAERLGSGEIGEVCVRGGMVTHRYDADESATSEAKIADGNEIIHRMGDLGRLDEAGRLWFVGRKSHRLETAHGMIPPVPVESLFNVHAAVHRTALVGVGERGQERPVLIIQLEEDCTQSRDSVLAELKALAGSDPRALAIEHYLFKEDFPVDVRHNAKIRRELLKTWAEAELL